MDNEYEKLLEYKNTKNIDIIYAFYLQYQGLISKFYYKGFYSNFHITLDDFKQESFLMLQSLLDYIDVDKITDSKNWKLYKLYIGKIMYYRGMLLNKAKKDAYYHSIDADMDEMNLIVYPPDNDLKLTLDIFINTLSSLDQTIFRSRFLNEDTKTYKEIACMCKRSYFYIYSRVESLSNQFYDYIKEEPSRRT